MSSLAEMRKAAGFERQIDLAKILNVRSITVGRYESGSRQPDLATTLRMAELFRVNMEDIAYAWLDAHAQHEQKEEDKAS